MFNDRSIREKLKPLRTLNGPNDRAAQRSVLEQYLNAHPMPKRRLSFLTSLLRPLPVIATAAVLVFTASGVAMAAESSLPGDSLYAIKVNLTEPLRSALTFSPVAKAAWESERIERRLDEFESLSRSGKLTLEKQAKLQTRINASTAAIELQISAFAQRGDDSAAADISANIEGAFEAHEQALKNLEAENETGDDQVKKVLEDVVSKRERLESESRKAEDQLEKKQNPETEVAARNHLAVAKRKIAEVRSALRRRQSRIQPGAVAQVQSKLAEAETMVTSGQQSLDEQHFAEAFRKFQRALKLAQQAKRILNAAKVKNTQQSVNRPMNVNRSQSNSVEDRNGLLQDLSNDPSKKTN